MKFFAFESKDSIQNMSLSEHLKELRKRLLVVCLAFILFFLIILPFASQLTNIMLLLGKNKGYNYIYLAPQELLLVQLNIVFFTSLALTFPLFIYHSYRFCAPAFSKQARKGLILSIILGFFFFILGLLFAFKVSLPFTLGFLIGFTAFVDVKASISISEYLNFVVTNLLIFGLVFEMPVISLLLTKIGILKPHFLVKARKVMIILIFIVAAIITPPDVVSQISVAIPMVFLYELSILICKITSKK